MGQVEIRDGFLFEIVNFKRRGGLPGRCVCRVPIERDSIITKQYAADPPYVAAARCGLPTQTTFRPVPSVVMLMRSIVTSISLRNARGNGRMVGIRHREGR